jgi:hypothetical protein
MELWVAYGVSATTPVAWVFRLLLQRVHTWKSSVVSGLFI